MAIKIRPYLESDAEPIAALYGRHRDNPNPVAGGISGSQLAQELAERGTAVFLVAADGDRVVGTIGLFRNTGRRTAQAGELIADMFFVAPSYRQGALTGILFAEAIEEMNRTECRVLRLTVNPANATAFRLYRRVGCVCVGETVPGEDGNVELHNYIPLILRSVVADLGDQARQALGRLTSFASVAQGRDDELSSDVCTQDGARTVEYNLALGDFRLDATVDVDQARVRRATLSGPDGTCRELQTAQPAYSPPPVQPPAPAHRLTSGDLVCEVDTSDGTIRVHTPRHHGPLLVATWPGCGPAHSAGWRESRPRPLQITRINDTTLSITERCGNDEATATVAFTGGVLDQKFTFTSQPGRLFHSIGLRQGSFTISGTRHPIGLGLGVRDASEIAAAAGNGSADSALAWTGTPARIDIPAGQPVRLVHSCLVERLLKPGQDGVACVRTGFWLADEAGHAAPPQDALPASTPRTAPPHGGTRLLRMDAGAGGITSWTEDTTDVLRSPRHHSSAFACNPRWTAGMWVTAERSRTDRQQGLGWGARTPPAWEHIHPHGLSSPAERLSWEVTEVPGSPLTAQVRAAAAEGDAVLWATPHTPRRTTVVIKSAGGSWQLYSSQFRQVWATAAAVQLSSGDWLACRAGPGAPADAEIVVRSTASGLLIGCTATAGPTHPTSSFWELDVRSEPHI